MKEKKIIFIGCVDFSRTVLQTLIKKKTNIVGICTKRKSKINSDFFNLKSIATKHKIPWIYWKKSNDYQIYSWLKNKNPDFIFCVGWPNIINQKYLKLAKYFCVGFHPSDLPFNRGRHPLIWSIILKFKFIASTFFIMSKYPDNGVILSKKKIKINALKENSNSLYLKLKKTSRKQIKELLDIIGKKKNVKNSNKLLLNNLKNGNFLRKRSYEDGLIDWRMSAENIDALVRALFKPYAGAEFNYKNKKIKIWKTQIIKSGKTYEPGKIITSKGKPIIQTGNNKIQLLEIEPKIKFKMGEYLR